MPTIWLQISLNLSIITACIPSLKSVLDSLFADTGVIVQAPYELSRNSAALFSGTTLDFDEELARLASSPSRRTSSIHSSTPPPRHNKFRYSAGRATPSSMDTISETSYGMQDFRRLDSHVEESGRRTSRFLEPELE